MLAIKEVILHEARATVREESHKFIVCMGILRCVLTFTSSFHLLSSGNCKYAWDIPNFKKRFPPARFTSNFDLRQWVGARVNNREGREYRTALYHALNVCGE